MTEIGNQGIRDYLSALSAKTSTPGGGAVAAVVGAEAIGLISMVAAFSDTDECAGIVARAKTAIDQLLSLADDDAAAFNAVMKTWRSEEREKTEALEQAANVPASVAKTCSAFTGDLAHLAEAGNRNLITDVGIAASLLASALVACEMNIRINLRQLTAPPADLVRELGDLPATVATLTAISERVTDQLR